MFSLFGGFGFGAFCWRVVGLRYGLYNIELVFCALGLLICVFGFWPVCSFACEFLGVMVVTWLCISGFPVVLWFDYLLVWVLVVGCMLCLLVVVFGFVFVFHCGI